MKRTCAFAFLVSVAMLSLSCQQPQAEAPQAAAPQGGAASAEPETGPDPTVVDPDHYTVDQENERMRVVRIKYGPGEESVMHYHPAGMAVFLTSVHGSFEMPDGTTQAVDTEAGQTMLLDAGQHRPRNLGDEPFEVIQVELKD